MAKFHAIVYVHGMGNQHRHEELSGLAHAFHNYSKVVGPHGQHLSRAEPHNELLRTGNTTNGGETEIAYLKAMQPDGEHLHEHRFYEVYWAPITAGGTSALEVLRWIFPQSLNALRLIRSKFHEYGRLRLVFLHRIYATQNNQEQRRPEFNELLAQYKRFAYPDNEASASKQTFVSFLERSMESKPELKGGVMKLAKFWIWRQRLGFIMDFVILLLTTLLIFQVLFALLITLLAASLVTGTGIANRVFNLFNLNDLIQNLTTTFKQSAALQFVRGLLERCGPFWSPVLAGAVLIGVLWLLWKGQLVLRDFLGDVQQWTTYAETDKKNQVRQRILQRTRDVLMHTLNHPDCERVTLIGHSLGSAIALDTLSRLGREIRAELDGTELDGTEPKTPPNSAILEAQNTQKSLVETLQKLTAFITYGSPIDKIYYFFESRRLPLREYHSLIERQRGDLTSEPFNTEPFKTGITWLNLFDHGDPVSSELYSFAPSTTVNPFVHNVEVASHNLPHPASHGAYIHNKPAMELIFNLSIKQQKPLEKPFTSNRALQIRFWIVAPFWFALLIVGLVPVVMLWPMPNSTAITILIWDLALFGLLVMAALVSGQRNRYTKT